MRIAINTRFLIRDRLEGIGWFTHEVARRLVEQHPEHEFLFLFDRPYDPAFLFGPSVRARVLFPPARHALLWWWWFEVAVPRALRAFGADVFLSPDGYCSLRSKVPTIMVTHDIAHVHYPEQIPLHGRLFYRHFVPRYLRRADRIITVSNFVREDILAHYPGLSPAGISVACNGSKDHFRPLDEATCARIRAEYADGCPYFFYVGAVHPRKNLDRLIQAFDRFREDTGAPVRLLLGGRLAWQTGQVRAAWEQARHRGDIRFLGYVSEEALPQLMGAALALTYVSCFEGFGVPLLEAMHAEVPVLTAAVSSLPEVAGDAALLVDPRSVESIADALRRLYEEPALRAKLVAAGRQQRGKFTWEKATAVIWENIRLLTSPAESGRRPLAGP